MAPPSPVRAVLFDRDDTIAFTDPGVYRDAALWGQATFGLDPHTFGAALHEQWQRRALSWWHLRTPADEDAFWQDYGVELANQLNLNAAQTQALMNRWPYEAYMKPVPNPREVLHHLRNQGLRVGVLSNTLPSIDRTLKFVGLDDLVDAAVATCTVGVHKPEPGAYLHAAQQLGVPPREILFVDDKQENVDAARAVGMHATLIDLRGTHPEAIHDLQEVLALVDALNAHGTVDV
ncbi:HAD family phosphatase [Deinococcus taeanensis]|uniref:HAD family hydrolase n=1 Tax=Deinococcus taeanensis TaxID=2737050 RepID=UPI001CDD7314|nr:HAD family phosphatase [Deinococcus taeanensis]UBV43793.1 HAD family phosphatase [Deinococcus taeanensis]